MKKNVKIIVGLVAVVLIGIGFACYQFFFHTVPDVVQKEEAVAEQIMDYAGFEYEIKKEYSSEVQKGHVVSQSVEGGKSKMRGSTITLVVSRGEEIRIPDFSGMSFKKAKKLAKDKKLKLRKAGTKPSKSISAGCVVGQERKPGDVCEEGTVIQVIVSSGSTGNTVGGYTYQSESLRSDNLNDTDEPEPEPDPDVIDDIDDPVDPNSDDETEDEIETDEPDESGNANDEQ